jgi:hypothetical protein
MTPKEKLVLAGHKGSRWICKPFITHDGKAYYREPHFSDKWNGKSGNITADIICVKHTFSSSNILFL